MLGHKAPVDARKILVVGSIVVKSVNIAYCEEEMIVNMMVAADLLNALFAKSQRNAKTRQHKD